MKNVLRLLVFAALVTVFALPSYAQDAAATQTPAAGPCTTEAEAKGALYQKFLANYKGTAEQQKTAYDTGKEYGNKYGTCPDDADKKVASFIQNWVTKYEKATLEFNCKKAVNESPATAFTACKPFVDANPDNTNAYLLLVNAGLKNVQAKNKALNAEAANAARRALKLIEQGKNPDAWAPLPNQAEAVPALNYYIGVFTFDNAPAEAATYLVKAAQSNSSFAKEPTTYEYLAAAYYNNEFTPLAAEYKAKYEGKEATPESEALFNKINAVTHRIVDAYARAVALSPTGPAKDDRRKKLSTFYKQLHDGKEDGMNELVAGILTKPIMLPGQEPPPPPPTTTTTNADGTNGTGAAMTPTTPAGGTVPAKPAATPAKPTATPTPKPAATPAQKPATPAQKPPRSRT
jgi:hypothetical protein